MSEPPGRADHGSDQSGQARARPSPLTPEIVELDERDDSRERETGMPFGVGGGAFGPRAFGGGRVRVYGCSPGCLLISVVISLILTLLLNAIL